MEIDASSSESGAARAARRRRAFVVVSIGLAAIVVLIAAVVYLDRRIEAMSEAGRREVRPPGAESGASPGDLPRTIVRGQRVYVPLYSHVYSGEGSRLLLACTLSIRNTDPERSLTIAKVTYYDTEGSLVREFLDRPLKLKPLGSHYYVIKESDTAGGAGASFIVEWLADEPVHEPVIEAVMVGRDGPGRVAFARTGVVVENRSGEGDGRDPSD